MSATERLRYLALVRSFHVLAEAPGVSDTDIDLNLLDAWAMHEIPHDELMALRCSPFPGEATKCAVRFVLNLWDSQYPWKVGKFCPFAALRYWDDPNTRAWQAWARNPWRP